MNVRCAWGNTNRELHKTEHQKSLESGGNSVSQNKKKQRLKTRYLFENTHKEKHFPKYPPYLYTGFIGGESEPWTFQIEGGLAYGEVPTENRQV